MVDVKLTYHLFIIYHTLSTGKQGVLDGEEDFPGQRILSTGSHDTSNPDNLKQLLLDAVSCLASAVSNFLIMYAKAFRVDFTVDMNSEFTNGNNANCSFYMTVSFYILTTIVYPSSFRSMRAQPQFKNGQGFERKALSKKGKISL